MRARDGEEAVFQIVEAVLVAVLVAGALIFFALVQRSPGGASGEGQGLALAAADALDIIDAQGALDDLADDVETGDDGGMAGTSAITDVHNALDDLLPTGLLYEARTECGGGGTGSVTGPSGATVGSPRNAQASAAYAVSATNGVCLLELVVWNGF